MRRGELSAAHTPQGVRAAPSVNSPSVSGSTMSMLANRVGNNRSGRGPGLRLPDNVLCQLEARLLELFRDAP